MAGGNWRKRGKIHYVRCRFRDLCFPDFTGPERSKIHFYRTNEDATRELFWKDYEFGRTFVVAEDALKEEKVVLVCEGLDTLTDIYINGKKAGSTDNMHRIWKLDVKEFLHAGENQIRIVFRSVFKYIEDYEYEEIKRSTMFPAVE